MPDLKIGVQVASLRMPFKKALPHIANMGATAVELDARYMFNPREMSESAMRQIRKWLGDYNLQVCAVSFRTRRGYDVAEDLQNRIDATKSAMQFAYAMGTSTVINQVGQVPSQEEIDASSPRWETLLAALTDLGTYGQRTGAWLAMETGTESGEDLARLIQALPEGTATVNLDPGNLIVNGFSPAEAVQSLGSAISHVHAKDGVRDLAQGRGLEVALGRGSADFPHLLGQLEEFNYRGYFTIERENANEPIQEIALATQYLRNI